MFQRWVRKFGGGGPFSDPTAIVSLESLAQPGPGSLWRLHGKTCPRCRRMLSRASTLENSAGRASSILLVATAIVAVVKARLGQKLTMPLAAVVLVVLLQLIGRWAGQAHKKMHREINYDAISDVYAY